MLNDAQWCGASGAGGLVVLSGVVLGGGVAALCVHACVIRAGWRGMVFCGFMCGGFMCCELPAH